MADLPLVLIVEDSLTQAKATAALVSNFQAQTQIVGDGLDALRAVDQKRPDVIILDVHLPAMNEYQVCHRLKRNPATADIPVIMLTVSDSAEAAIQGLEAGADDYIPKDVWAAEHLSTALRTYLELVDH